MNGQVEAIGLKNSRGTVRAMVSALALVLVSSNAAAAGLTIVSPSPNTTVQPGSSVTFQVNLDPALLPAEVHLFAKGLIDETISGGPSYSRNITVPPQISGPWEVLVIASKPAGGGLAGDASATVTLNVIPDEAPLRLDVNDSVYLDPRPSGGFSSEKLSVRGLYGNEIERNLTLAMLGTTYRSSDVTVATVDANGQVQGISTGTAYITVENRAVRRYVDVTVRGANRREPPPKDITSKVSITAGGFRYDTETRQYVQELSIRNTSNEPIFWPITLVISDLPAGVRLENTGTRTRVVTPLKSGTISLNFARGDEPYAMPGEAGTATLKFTNREGRPITYTARLFFGAHL